MTSAADGQDPPGAGSSTPAQPSLLQTLQGLWNELPGLINDRVDLLTLEMQRAGRALLQIVALVVAAAILAVTGWLALWSVIVGVLMQLGLHWTLALVLVLAINIAAAWWAVARIRSLLPSLRLSATRRHMTFLASPGGDGAAGTEPRAAAEPPYASNTGPAPG